MPVVAQKQNVQAFVVVNKKKKGKGLYKPFPFLKNKKKFTKLS